MVAGLNGIIFDDQLTFDPDFKVTTFFDIEYLRNNMRQSHSYYRKSVGSHMCSIEW